MASELWQYSKAVATEHPLISSLLAAVASITVLPPLAFAALLSSPFLVPIGLAWLVHLGTVRSHVAARKSAVLSLMS